MDIKNRKTVLDDDASLYQDRDQSFKRKDISHLTKKEKFGYFKDYYLKQVLVVIAVVILVVALIYTTVFNRKETILSVGFLNETYMDQTDCLKFSEGVRNYYGWKDENQIIDISYYDLDDYAMNMKFATMTGARELDAVVCPKETFEKYSGLGFFEDLSKALPETLYREVSDKIVESCEVETDEEGKVTKRFPAKPYGIDIAGNPLFGDCEGIGDDTIFCVVAGSNNQENAVKLADYIVHYN